MGFGTVAAQAIMFISLMSVATALVLVFDTQTQETTAAMAVRSNALVDALKTDFTITSVTYNKTVNWTYIYALNTGSTELTLNSTDVLIDGLFIARDNRKNITIVATTQTRNPLSWDPSEVVEIIVNRTYSANTTHVVDVVSEFGIRKTGSFSWG